MIGLGSVELAVVFWLVIISSLWCIGYGILNWNKGGEADSVGPLDEKPAAKPGDTPE